MPCCPGVIVTPTDPGCPTNCFRAADITVSCLNGGTDNGIDPCGGVYNFDLAAEIDNDSSCSENGVPCGLVFQKISHSDHFLSVTISSAGAVVATAAASPEMSIPASLGLIKYRVYCPCNSYSATGELYICINNLCANQVCGEGLTCNPCTGLCVPQYNGGLQ
jgi:hypothetical protein